MSDDRRSIGLPIMREEEGEKRAFLPDFINYLVQIGFDVFLEFGYGQSIGYNISDYKKEHADIHFVSREETFNKNYVLILRSPHEEEFKLIGENSCLISMLHFPTRSIRMNNLRDMGIKAISLDSIENDFGVRLVENMRAVAWNGIEAAFDDLEEKYPHLLREQTRPWSALVVGSGMVGKHAVDAATKFGKRSRNRKHMDLEGEGIIVQTVGRNISAHPERLQSLMTKTDVFIDSTQRYDPSQPIIKNEWIKALPEHAIIVDLSVDPYLLDDNPPVVKGVEGIPHGNLDQYVFHPNDPQWTETIPREIPSQERRTTVTCYSWPGIHPEDSMRHYGQQLRPFMRVLVKKDYADLNINSPFFERALYRASLTAQFENQ